MGRDLFREVHPLVILTYGICALVFAMWAMQPVCCIVIYAAVFLLTLLVKGTSGLGGRVAFQLVLIFGVAALNALLSSNGGTALIGPGLVSMTAEGLVYGVCMGLALVNTVQIFLLLGTLVSSDDAMVLFGGRLPTMSLMTSMSLGLVPHIGRQAQEMSDVKKACTAVRTSEGQAAFHARMVATLSSNALEDSIVRADSMRARSWGSGPRTHFRRRPLEAKDVLMLVSVLLLAASAAIGVHECLEGSAIYPALALTPCLICYVPLAVFLAVPFFAALVEVAVWRR